MHTEGWAQYYILVAPTKITYGLASPLCIAPPNLPDSPPSPLHPYLPHLSLSLPVLSLFFPPLPPPWYPFLYLAVSSCLLLLSLVQITSPATLIHRHVDAVVPVFWPGSHSVPTGREYRSHSAVNKARGEMKVSKVNQFFLPLAATS